MAILLTHARQFAGPGSVPILLRDHGILYCHDASFADPSIARSFEAEHDGAVALVAQTPPTLLERFNRSLMGDPFVGGV